MIFNDKLVLRELAIISAQAQRQWAELVAIKTLVHLGQSRQRDKHIEEMLMTIQAEIQALLDAVKEQGDAIASASDELVSLETKVEALTTQLNTVQTAQAAGTPVDAENLAAIVAATSTITSSIGKLKDAMPKPVATAVVDAAANPA